MPGPMPVPVPVPAPAAGARPLRERRRSWRRFDHAGQRLGRRRQASWPECSTARPDSARSWPASALRASAASSTGTVILSLPGSSALRGGSFIWLPPPPPPPPGPGWLNQTMLAVRLVGQQYAAGERAARAEAQSQQREPDHGEVIGERRHERRAHALLLLLEQERDVDRVRTFDVHREMPGGRIGTDRARLGGLCHGDCELACRDIVAHVPRRLQLQKGCLACPLVS